VIAVVEPERVSYKDVVKDLKRRVETAISTLWRVHDSITISNALCGETSCKDCPARETCYIYLGKAINRIKNVIVDLASLKRELGYIIAELTGEEWVVSQEVKC